MLQLNFNSISEAMPGEKWQKLFNTHWPAYKAWFESKGAAHQPSLETCVENLKKYMPEYLPTYKRLCALAGDDEVAARFLTGYQPPAYISGCSQVVWQDEPMLVRNYDYHPHLSEGTVLLSAWNGKQVLATGDCLSGVVDGMNGDGLVVSLTFGGRKIVGKGFGIPFIIRYVLEFCSSIAEAVEALQRIPSHMSYNIMLLDKSGAYKMLQLSPDNPAVVTDTPASTNHQGKVDWPEHAQFSKTVEREKFILDALYDTSQNRDSIVQSFLNPPLFNRLYSDGFGTVYTAVYKPLEGSMELKWQDKNLLQSFSDFKECNTLVTFTEKVPMTAPSYHPAEPAQRDTKVPAQQQPAYQVSEYSGFGDANYWIEYGQSWASGNPTQLSQQIAKSIVASLGLPADANTRKIIDQFMNEEKRRGQVPWEMLADLWSNLG